MVKERQKLRLLTPTFELSQHKISIANKLKTVPKREIIPRSRMNLISINWAAGHSKHGGDREYLRTGETVLTPEMLTIAKNVRSILFDGYKIETRRLMEEIRSCQLFSCVSALEAV